MTLNIFMTPWSVGCLKGVAFSGRVRVKVKVKVKLKFTLEKVMKTLRGSRRIAVLFRYPRRQMGRVVNGRPRQVYPREGDPISIVQEAGWAPGQVWTGAENLASTGIRSPDSPSRSESLYRLSYPDPLQEGNEQKYFRTAVQIYDRVRCNYQVRTRIRCLQACQPCGNVL